MRLRQLPSDWAGARSVRDRGFVRWAIASLTMILERRHRITWFKRERQDADPITALRAEVFRKRAR
jgi:hypothetical protein